MERKQSSSKSPLLAHFEAKISPKSHFSTKTDNLYRKLGGLGGTNHIYFNCLVEMTLDFLQSQQFFVGLKKTGIYFLVKITLIFVG